MKTVFTTKYLQHLNSKKKDGGFTLIELLVVIIIVGVLAAIALPSFLNQIGKARGSEAKASLGTINRSQQAYRLENNSFSNNISNLDAKVTGKFYTYEVSASNQNDAAHQTTSQQDDLKVYSSYVLQSGDNFSQFLCESNATVNGQSAAMTSSTCPANYKGVE